MSKEKKFKNWNKAINIARKVKNEQKKFARAEKTIIKKWDKLAHYLIKEKPYNIMSKIRTLAKNENLLDWVQISLHSIIIAKTRHFGDLNIMMDIRLKANNYSQLIKMPSLPFFLVTQAELNEFELEIDQEIYYFSMPSPFQ